MTPPNPPPLSRAELEIMQIVWDLEFATVAEVVRRTNERRPKPLQRTTIQVQMNRLQEKGWLKRSRAKRERGVIYQPTRGRDEISVRIVRDLLDRLFAGSFADLARCLFENREISKEEVARLRLLIDSADAPRKRSRRA